jgi:pimeloyl-ACP methyl ester carboxylesterase
MIHGVPGSHRDFRWLAPPLEQAGLRVIRLDMPGFAGTEAISPRPSALAEHILARVEALGLARVILLGHSFGGPLSLLAAARDPARVRALALLSSVGLRPHRSFREARKLLTLRPALHTPGLRWPLTWGLRRLFVRTGFSPRTTGAEVRRTVDLLAHVDFRAIDNARAALRLPTLVAYAEDDPFIEAAIAEELAAAVPEGPRLRFASGGHNPQKHQACEIAEALIPFARDALAR